MPTSELAKSCAIPPDPGSRRVRMTAPGVVRAQREEDLRAFEATLRQIGGVTEEHLTHLARASTTMGTAAPFPKDTDPVGMAAYQAAALRAIAEAFFAQQATKKK
jgi:hypothetical protein